MYKYKAIATGLFLLVWFITPAQNAVVEVTFQQNFPLPQEILPLLKSGQAGQNHTSSKRNFFSNKFRTTLCSINGAALFANGVGGRIIIHC